MSTVANAFRAAFERELDEVILERLKALPPRERVGLLMTAVLTTRVFDKHYDSKGNPKNV